MALNNFDAEMSRFENEISNVNTVNAPPRMPIMPSVPPPPGMFPPIIPGLPPLPPPPPGVMAQLMNNNNAAPSTARLPPRPAFVPHQLRHRVPQQSVPFPSSSMRPAQMAPSIPQRVPSPPPPSAAAAITQGSVPPPPQQQQQSTLSAQPLLYKNQTSNEKSNQPSESIVPTSQRPSQTPIIENKPSASKLDKPLVNKVEQNPHPVSKAFAASSSQPMETNDHDNESSSTAKKKNKAKPPKKLRHVRMAGGTTWEDETLAEWDPDDFRLFCGDLGNEVNDDVLTRAFNKYPSFQKAKVVRDKRSGKTRGYGFISFKDSQDYIRAMREMNGKYVGNRPIKLRKSTWRERNMDIVKKKMKDKVKMGLR
ncbi:unnamed protein product [Rotaria sp. Silwood1]|nr:unnamed protein product [Rotaria sp. Silwood1]CAF1054473.1 unnamed protein product [Rotaria sp. Silwood1]CAF3435576.1 unnamed protein product [Rotaria sp. Silwood1]CAF3517115.1 unnamed protein product [Rotaria sp. Silwood1]CAF3531540.1 unnamed protein product [Rotaria sp. Silwood1]